MEILWILLQSTIVNFSKGPVVLSTVYGAWDTTQPRSI